MLDLALAFYLVLVLPTQRLYRSIRPREGPKRTIEQRYLLSMRDIGLMLLALLFICWRNGYGAADMGLALPAAGVPLWCLLAASATMAAPLIANYLSTRKMASDKRATLLQRSRDGGMPTTPSALRLFAVLVLFIGAGWELLYRGFLVLALTPYIGVWPTVLLSGLAYGAAHGYKSPMQFSLSILSALLFAAGYVLSGSLWWLMVIHIVLPLTNAITTQQLIKISEREEAQHALS
jgi:membrane protease YdiL (CAAX protease family)